MNIQAIVNYLLRIPILKIFTDPKHKATQRQRIGRARHQQAVSPFTFFGSYPLHCLFWKSIIIMDQRVDYEQYKKLVSIPIKGGHIDKKKKLNDRNNRARILWIRWTVQWHRLDLNFRVQYCSGLALGIANLGMTLKGCISTTIAKAVVNVSWKTARSTSPPIHCLISETVIERMTPGIVKWFDPPPQSEELAFLSFFVSFAQPLVKSWDSTWLVCRPKPFLSCLASSASLSPLKKMPGLFGNVVYGMSITSSAVYLGLILLHATNMYDLTGLFGQNWAHDGFCISFKDTMWNSHLFCFYLDTVSHVVRNLRFNWTYIAYRAPKFQA